MIRIKAPPPPRRYRDREAREEGQTMTPGEIAYLALVIGAAGVFAAAMLWATWKTGA